MGFDHPIPIIMQWRRVVQVLVLFLLISINIITAERNPRAKRRWYSYFEGDCRPWQQEGGGGGSYCLSWRTAVETGNVRAWRTVPSQCLRHVETYMIGGQYNHDLSLIVENILSYVNNEIVVSEDGMDAWILDVDDTCLSNMFYYRAKRFGYVPLGPFNSFPFHLYIYFLVKSKKRRKISS